MTQDKWKALKSANEFFRLRGIVPRPEQREQVAEEFLELESWCELPCTTTYTPEDEES